MAGSLVAHDLELEEAISRFAPSESAPNRLEPSNPSSGKPSANGDRTAVELDAGRVTVVSAPGKVLMAGGYLVLDRENEGLVVATSARFYCCVTDLPLDKAASDSDMAAQLIVRAGQFPSEASTWSYTVSLSTGDGTSSPSLSLEPADKEASASRNKFIEITLSVVLHYAWEALRGKDCSDAGSTKAAEQLIKLLKGTSVGQLIAVFADNDFYSQRDQLSQLSLPMRFSSLDRLSPFQPLPRAIAQTNKTGLGSSASLVTSLVSGLLTHLSLIQPPSSGFQQMPQTFGIGAPALPSPTASLGIVHSLAQLAHCIAQGKVGSGFDVSSAVYGTHIYRRFSPSVLTPLLQLPTSPITLTSETSLLANLAAEKWDHETTTSFRLPRGLRLLLADVDAGTDTPSFVGKVLKWREASPDQANALWGQLRESNKRLEEELRRLARLENSQSYVHELAMASKMDIREVDNTTVIGGHLRNISRILGATRKLMREMSGACDVPIEPKEQTRLLDACSRCPGVLGGGVPGAGGYDAIFLLAIDAPDVVSVIEDLWESWTEMSVCPLSARQSDGGLWRENINDISDKGSSSVSALRGRLATVILELS